MKLKDNPGVYSGIWILEWEGLKSTSVSGDIAPTNKKNFPSPDHEGETVWEMSWDSITPDILPDTIYLTNWLNNIGQIRIPIQVRSSGT